LAPDVSYPVPSLGLVVVVAGIAVDCCTLTVVEIGCPVIGVACVGCTGVAVGAAPEGPVPPLATVDP